MKLPPHKLVKDGRSWQACLKKLQAESRLAIDLEANSMFAYQERVCLIQISIPSQDYIIDPLSPFDLDELGILLANPDVEKVFHAAEYDLILMKREYKWEVNNLFDTMWAARILGYRRYGLANILNEVFQVKLNKRYQKSNWCKRPLSAAQRKYAQHDTHYLLALRDHLDAELKEAGRQQEAQEIFAEQTQVHPSNNEFDPDSFWSINGVHDLNRRQQAILKALNIYRDQEAERRDRPHFKILSDKTLLQLTRAMPRHLSELRRIHGMTPGQIRRYGKKIVKTIEKAKKDPYPPYPKRPKRPPEAVANRYDKLHNWRKTRAQARGVESDVIVSRDALWAIAWANPQAGAELAQIDELGSWRFQTYGKEILELLNQD